MDSRPGPSVLASWLTPPAFPLSASDVLALRARLLARLLPVRDVRKMLATYRACFSGDDLVHTLTTAPLCGPLTRPAATALATALLAHRFIVRAQPVGAVTAAQAAAAATSQDIPALHPHNSNGFGDGSGSENALVPAGSGSNAAPASAVVFNPSPEALYQFTVRAFTPSSASVLRVAAPAACVVDTVATAVAVIANDATVDANNTASTSNNNTNDDSDTDTVVVTTNALVAPGSSLGSSLNARSSSSSSAGRSGRSRAPQPFLGAGPDGTYLAAPSTYTGGPSAPSASNSDAACAASPPTTAASVARASGGSDVDGDAPLWSLLHRRAAADATAVAAELAAAAPAPASKKDKEKEKEAKKVAAAKAVSIAAAASTNASAGAGALISPHTPPPGGVGVAGGVSASNAIAGGKGSPAKLQRLLGNDDAVMAVEGGLMSLFSPLQNPNAPSSSASTAGNGAGVKPSGRKMSTTNVNASSSATTGTAAGEGDDEDEDESRDGFAKDGAAGSSTANSKINNAMHGPEPPVGPVVASQAAFAAAASAAAASAGTAALSVSFALSAQASSHGAQVR